ncbi:MAG: hypothetical protein RDU89_10015 [bacterium]|nr:hypothetical protein [bacterium]
MVLLLLGGGLSYVWIQAGVNPLHLARAILVLQCTGQEMVRVTPRVFIQRAGPGDGPLNAYLAARGWEFRDRLGAILAYEREGAHLLVHVRHTRGYLLYELQGEDL